MGIIEAVVTAIVKMLISWLVGRSEGKAAKKAAANKTAAFTEQDNRRDKADNQEAKSYAKETQAIDVVRGVNYNADGLRRQSNEVNAAINSTNGDVR